MEMSFSAEFGVEIGQVSLPRIAEIELHELLLLLLF